ncbi:MAG: hypothetical protein V7632_1305 [Bradyrhizobium sp.]|jgi:hypothetical protein
MYSPCFHFVICAGDIRALKDMGVAPPKAFPSELDFNEGDEDSDEEEWERIDGNPYSALIYKIYQSLTDVYGFYIAYVEELISDNDDLLNTDADNIESCLIELAASKVEDISEQFAPRVGEFRYKVRKQYAEWLTLVKDKSFRAGAPLRVELMDMVNDGHDALGHTAEAESLGFNSSRLHPDIYMNELLEGMRVIHQALPVIMKRLGAYREFKLDTSILRNDTFHRPGGDESKVGGPRTPWTSRRMMRQRSPKRFLGRRNTATRVANLANRRGGKDATQ